MERIKEILKRQAQIAEALKGEYDAAKLEELDNEFDSLEEEKRGLKEVQEKRQKMLKNLAGEPQVGVVSSVDFAPNMRGGDDAETDETDIFASKAYRSAFKDFVSKGVKIPQELRAGDVTFTSDIEAVIPTTIMNKIYESFKSHSEILSRVLRTNLKGGVQVPISAVKPIATWEAEGQSGNTHKKVIGTISFQYFKLCCAVANTLEVETMSLPIFEQKIVKNIVEAMNKELDNVIINGDGTTQPKGILTETPNAGQIVTVTDNAVTYENLIAAEAALPQAYDNDAVWVMSKATRVYIQGIKDASGQPILHTTPNPNGKLENSIFGRQVVLCDNLPSIKNAADGEVFGFLFNLKDYILNTNLKMNIIKYVDYPTRNKVFDAVTLVDGKVALVDSLVVLKNSKTAAPDPDGD